MLLYDTKLSLVKIEFILGNIGFMPLYQTKKNLIN